MRLINYLFLFIFLGFTPSMSENPTGFKEWKNSFRNIALENNISKETFDTVMANIKFLPNVIKYDRYQPEFYEDTKTYISKRTSSKKVSKGIDFYKKNTNLINRVENHYDHLSLLNKKQLAQRVKYKSFLLEDLYQYRYLFFF